MCFCDYQPFLNSVKTCLATALSVSKTPTPCEAVALNRRKYIFADEFYHTAGRHHVSRR
ncbi:MAG TPA: hypothetical protein VNI60_06605 [Pyrinomonadaceae bacterium]|nr:hypothetical protein [Pyrinomonadaceae bacterium]